VTGGSSGTGAALAVLLAKQGAHVSIVARNEERLAQVTQEMEVPRQLPLYTFAIIDYHVQAARQSKDQRFRWYSYSLSSSSGSEAALKAASEPFGGACPEAVFLCAGFSKPGFFIEQDEESMMNGMDSTYWVQAWSALVSRVTLILSLV
jgi:3-dehydrosphinganine reductase